MTADPPRPSGSQGCGGPALDIVFERLYRAYGPQCWWPGDSPFEIAVGAILTQSAAWVNVEKALRNLKDADALSPTAIREMDERTLSELIRPSGYYNTKARKLKAFVELLYQRFGGSVEAMSTTAQEEARQALLATYGIGPETADSILLYAAGHPVFVVDAYTQRLLQRLGVRPPAGGYEAWQRLVTDVLPRDSWLYKEFHALIVRHGKEVCRSTPRCRGCPLLDICATGKEQARSEGITLRE
jgi:endonuclease-3 related protein